jgi:amidase
MQTYLTMKQMSDALTARKVSSVELAKDAFDSIRARDGLINAMCVLDEERAMSDARAADLALAQGEKRELLGIPITVKESLNVERLPTTWGIPSYRDFIADEDAVAVARLRSAGSIILGKTNVPEGLFDYQSYNDLYGTTRNPFDPDRTPGGSSGGSSAALAVGYGAASIGSDVAGSLRVPAAFCGIYAHKPTLSLIPTRGHVPPSQPAIPVDRDLAVVGPMARSATDLALLLKVLAGPEDLGGISLTTASLPAPRHADLRNYRVLCLTEHPLMPTSAKVSVVFEKFVSSLEGSGIRQIGANRDVPDLASSTRLYMRLLMSFVSSSWTDHEYVGVQRELQGLNPADASLEAERIRGSSLSHREWLMADVERRKNRFEWRSVFENWDLVLCPVAPTPPYKHDHSTDVRHRTFQIDGKHVPYLDQFGWSGIATLPGLPSTAFPIGFTSDGLPVGAQAIGPWLGDLTTIKFAELAELEFGGFVAPPNRPADA